MSHTGGPKLVPLLAASLAACLLIPAPALQAQVIEQSFALQAGWNTIYLEVDPVPAESDTLFAGKPITSVWMRAPDPFIFYGLDCDGPDDPACQQVSDTGWRSWYPPGPAATLVSTLPKMLGGQAYLVEATQATNLTFKGMPSGFDPRYRIGYNLRGFHVVSNLPTAPTLSQYLTPALNLNPTAVYRMQLNGSVVLVPAPLRIVPGAAYFVLSSADFVYNGPLEIDSTTVRGVEFGRTRQEHSARFRNLAATARTVRLAYLTSLASTPAGFPAFAGNVPLFRLEYGAGDSAAEILQWTSLGAYSFPLNPAGPSKLARGIALGVQRVGLAPATVDENEQGSRYQGLLEITDGLGFRRLIPLSLEVHGEAAMTAGVAGGRPGLYVGSVSVNKVTWVTAGARVWTNDDAANPEFADSTRCFGGARNGESCVAGRKLCAGIPEVERMQQVCETNANCPAATSCVADCLGGVCRSFCIGGAHAGEACVDAVDCAGGGGGTCSGDLDGASLRPTAVEFNFPVIIHVSDFGEYKLLNEVSLWKNAGDRLVLRTPDCTPAVCNGLTGALIVDGQPVAPRVSTVGFSLDHDVVFDAGGGFGTSLATVLTIAPNDPLNPFRHKFHPDHDCNQPGECFEVQRALLFNFLAQPPNGASILDWGDSIVGGVYRESVTGLHKEAIIAEGRFELERVINIPRLNTPVDPGDGL